MQGIPPPGNPLKTQAQLKRERAAKVRWLAVLETLCQVLYVSLCGAMESECLIARLPAIWRNTVRSMTFPPANPGARGTPPIPLIYRLHELSRLRDYVS